MSNKKRVYTSIAIVTVLTAIIFGVSVFTIKYSEQETGGMVCNVSVSCETILNNMDMISEEKKDIIPEDGIVLASTQVSFNEGETAFEVLKKVLEDNKIHMEFSGDAKSAYVEGIANIYNFDCGEMSGWLYKVNGEAADRSAAEYVVSEGDTVEWIYSCDMGNDI